MTWKDLARSGACVRAHTTAQASLPDQIVGALTTFGFPSILLVAFLFLGSASNVVKADQITDTYGTGTPVMSWAYYNVPNVGKIGSYWTYYPFQSDYSNAVFQGYVSTPANGEWGPIYDFADQDKIFVFRTNVLSAVDQTISLGFGGDDNGTAYVNGVFQDYSHIFTKGGQIDLSLTAGIPVSLEIAIYNGPDGWVLGLRRPDGQNLIGNDSTITINATPEPATIFLFAGVLAGLAAGAYKKRGLTSKPCRSLMMN